MTIQVGGHSLAAYPTYIVRDPKGNVACSWDSRETAELYAKSLNGRVDGGVLVFQTGESAPLAPSQPEKDGKPAKKRAKPGPKTDPDQLLSPADVAEIKGVSYHTVFRAIQKGAIKAKRASDSPQARWVVRRADAERWVP